MDCTTPRSDGQEDLAAFWTSFPQDEIRAIALHTSGMLHGNTPRAFYHARHEYRSLRLDDILYPKGDSLVLSGAIVVVENINLPWIAGLTKSWHVSPSFFSKHASNPAGSSPWHTIFGTSVMKRKRPALAEVPPGLLASSRWDKAHYWHVDGISGTDQPGGTAQSSQSNQRIIQRLSVHSNEHGQQSSTRMSFWRCSDRLGSFCLILVDAPATEAPSTASSSSLPRFHLRFPVSNNRGGLVLPQLLDTAERSLFECLRRFLSHAWHFDILLVDGTHTIAPETFLYLLVTSTWETNLQNLTRDIKRISFEEVRKPNAAINDVLHDRRKDLIFLREQVALGKSWIPRSVAEQLQAIQAAAEKQQIHVGFPHERLGDVLVQAQSLERFLMDSFSLLISSTIVLQATLSTEQAVRGQKLTQLAFLYIPLSFVTGVFGMNVREINGSPLSIWVPVVVLGVTLVLTAAIFTSHGWWERRFVRRI